MMTTFKKIISQNLKSWWYILLLSYCLTGGYVGEACQNVIKVNQEAGLDCSATSVYSLVNQTCSDLQDVLMSVSADQSLSSFGECIELIVYSGSYAVTDTITIRQNVVLRGTRDVMVTFRSNDTLYPTNTLDPYHVLTFADSDYSEISGIDFDTSPGIITFQNVTNVSVEGCSFRSFTQGAVDIYNCPMALVTNCTFEHNGPVSVIKRGQYRGHAGGLSVGYYQDQMIAARPQLRIENCTFRNNTSDPEAILQQTTTQLLQRLAFTGRGGGCSIPISSSFPSNVTVENCLFEENFARSFGGGLYVAFDGQLDHQVILNRIKVVRNNCPMAAAGLAVGYITGSTAGSVSSLFAYNSEFIENQATFGGGVGVFPAAMGPEGQLSNFAHFENCTFTGNTAEILGAAIGFTSDLIHVFQNVENVPPFGIRSCTFISNDGGRGGAVSTANVPLSFSGFNVFKANRGRSLVVLASVIEVHGGINFIANNEVGTEGGALYIASMAYLQLFQGANLTFEGNRGIMGAAIVVEVHRVPKVYSKLLFNPLCFLHYENASQPPEQWENVFFKFSGNKAVVSSALFTANLDLCSWTQFENHHFFAPENVFQWDFVHIREVKVRCCIDINVLNIEYHSDDNENTAHYPDAFNTRWCIQTPAQKISITTKTLSAYPGEQFQVGVQALDELERPTAAVLRLSELNHTGRYLFNPAVITHDQIEGGSINTSFYTLAGANFGAEVVQMEPILAEEATHDSFTLMSSSCPPGYVLSAAPQGNMYNTCECDNQNSNIMDCNQHRIILKEGLWAAQDSRSLVLVSYPCPPQYCQCALVVQGGTVSCRFTFDSQNNDSQCTCDREGDLCGNCREGYGVSVLLNRCVSCHNASGVLIAVLIFVDVLVLIVLMLLQKPFPAWLYPCLFYIQVLPYLTQHFPLTFERLHPYVYYVSSGLSFYFIYDFCLYHGMSAPVSYLLRYLPLGTALVTFSTVMVIRCICKKPREPWYGLWWTVLFMYTHIIHTSMSILNCPNLPGKSGDRVPRWYINGNIKCFQGGHAPLGLLAILILALCVTLIPLVLVYSVGWVQHPGWLRHTAEVMQKGFKEKYKWWATVELGRRVLLLLFIVPFPGNEYPAIFILSVIIAVFGFLQPYKNICNNILESLLSLDVLVLLMMRNTQHITEQLQVLPHSNTTANGCTDINGVTEFTWLVSPFYYAPVAVLMLVTIVCASCNVRHYVLNRHNHLTVSEPQEDIGQVQHATTTTELEIKLLETPYTYTAFEDADQSRFDPDGAIVINIKSVDH